MSVCKHLCVCVDENSKNIENVLFLYHDAVLATMIYAQNAVHIYF